MCSPARCGTCGKTTWTGCGDHAEQVMAHVPVEQRCTCPPSERTGWFARLGGKR